MAAIVGLGTAQFHYTDFCDFLGWQAGNLLVVINLLNEPERSVL
jgi:hypothetical protein